MCMWICISTSTIDKYTCMCACLCWRVYDCVHMSTILVPQSPEHTQHAPLTRTHTHTHTHTHCQARGSNAGGQRALFLCQPLTQAFLSLLTHACQVPPYVSLCRAYVSPYRSVCLSLPLCMSLPTAPYVSLRRSLCLPLELLLLLPSPPPLSSHPLSRALSLSLSLPHTYCRVWSLSLSLSLSLCLCACVRACKMRMDHKPTRSRS